MGEKAHFPFPPAPERANDFEHSEGCPVRGLRHRRPRARGNPLNLIRVMPAEGHGSGREAIATLHPALPDLRNAVVAEGPP